MESSIATVRTKSCLSKITLFLAFATLTLGYLASPSKARSQELDHRQHGIITSKVLQPEKNTDVLFEGLKEQQESFLDENFTVYLIIYNSLISAGLSLVFATASFHLSDKRSSYTKVRRSTALLAAACGLGVGIFVANFEVPSDHEARLSLLLFLITTAAAVMWWVSWLAFIFMRSRTLRQAKLEGLSFSDRMRQG